VIPLECWQNVGIPELEGWGYNVALALGSLIMFLRFDTLPDRDGRTDGQTFRRRLRLRFAIHVPLTVKTFRFIFNADLYFSGYLRYAIHRLILNSEIVRNVKN